MHNTIRLLIRSLLPILLVFCCGRPMAADSLEVLQKRHQSIVTAFSQRDYSAAEKTLRELRTSEPEIFRANNYEYLLARVYEKRSDLTKAAEGYQKVIDQNSLLNEYARWHLAQIARQQRNLPVEREHLKKLLASFPDSLLAGGAQRRLADNYFESGDMNSALQFFRARANRASLAGREALGIVGLAYLKLGQDQAARASFDQLLSGSKDDQALLAAQKLDELDHKAQRPITEAELLTRARVYLFNRDAENARASYQQVVEKFPASKSMPEALYSIGRGYYIEYDFQNAIKWYERAHREFPASSQGELGFYHVGHALQNLGQYQDAVKRYQELIDQYPRSEWAGGAHLNAIDSLRSIAKYDQALEWSERAINRFSRDLTGTTALFAQAKIYLNRGDYNQALNSFTSLRNQNLSRTGPGSTNRNEVDFMRVFCLEKLGRINEAVDAYLGFPVDRNSYYGNRATLRLQALANDSNAKAVIAGKFKNYQESAKRELAGNNYNAAKAAANQALRLTTDDKSERELIEILRQCYNNLPGYRQYMSSNLDPAGRNLLTARDSNTGRSHRALADELIFLGLYDEGAPELRAKGEIAGLDDDDTVQLNNGNSPADDKTASLDNPDVETADVTATAESNNNDNGEIVDVSQRRRRGGRNSGNGGTTTRERRATGGGNWQYSLAVYLNRGSHAHPAIRYGESTFSGLPGDFRLELVSRDIAELLYPAPYRDEMSNEAHKRNIDPRFMLSIARQESRFNPAAKSASAARGIFQFIPATAEQIRKELKLAQFNQNELYLPPTAINFGAQYMGDLFGEFKDNPYAVAASYNGGEQAVRRWIERARDKDFDRFVIEVSYHESKDYVYKVLNNYWAYRQLYRDDLRER